MQVQDEYRSKASECLGLASDRAGKTGGDADRRRNGFFAMAMLWLRLAEASERPNRLAGVEGVDEVDPARRD